MEVSATKKEADIRKIYSRIARKSRQEAKLNNCYICRKHVSSFCNSHSVPQFILRTIAEDSELLQSSAIAGIPVADDVKGINNSGVFHLICSECDASYFSEYESPELLDGHPSNTMLAQIALKNYLLQISKRLFEQALYANLQKEYHRFENLEDLQLIHKPDLRDYEFSFRRAKKIIEKGLKSGFRLVYWVRLPYVVPITSQSAIALYKDLNGNIVFNIYDLSPEISTKELHLCVFPLVNSSIVMLFYHRDDRIYCGFERQFMRLNDKEKLEYVNYLIFRYTESYFVAKSLHSFLVSNKNLRELCRDTGEAPNLGFLTRDNMIKYTARPYQSVKPNQIPNLLAEEFKLMR